MWLEAWHVLAARQSCGAREHPELAGTGSADGLQPMAKCLSLSSCGGARVRMDTSWCFVWFLPSTEPVAECSSWWQAAVRAVPIS